MNIYFLYWTLSQIGRAFSNKFTDTRNKNCLHRQTANLTYFQKCAYHAGFNIFINLHAKVISVMNEKVQFKVALKRYFYAHFFYSIAEHLMFRDDRYCIIRLLFYIILCVRVCVYVNWIRLPMKQHISNEMPRLSFKIHRRDKTDIQHQI